MKHALSHTLVALLLVAGPLTPSASANCTGHHAPPFISGGIGEDERLDSGPSPATTIFAWFSPRPAAAATWPRCAFA